MLNPYDFSSIVVLTGAGISAESGLKTFRDDNGLWEGHRVEDVATPEGFYKDPDLVHTFYNQRRQQLLTAAKANEAHQALANFQKSFPGKFTLVTQNVDNLHEQGGSENVLHMHGELLKARCKKSGEVIDIYEDLSVDTVCSCCNEIGNMRPHIVWFGEMPFYMGQIETALVDCDLFISIGTSGQVYPAAGFVQLASASGAIAVELNLEATDGSNNFDHAYQGPATELVPSFFQQA